MRSFLAFLVAAALSACAGNDVKMEENVSQEPAMDQMQEMGQAQMDNAQSSEMGTSDMRGSAMSDQDLASSQLNDPSHILSRRSVYFDFDQYEIKQEYRLLVEAHAKYLVDHPRASVTLQGNADDRGSREYNLALGQKRAATVKKIMNLLGVSDRQIETISFGEEKPRAMGQNERSWAENRRVDIVYN